MSNDTAFAAFLATNELADLGPGPRPGIESEASLNGRLRQNSEWTKLSTERQELVQALILLWHDHLDSAHTIAQSVDNADGAFVHGIMHRREPDYGNATYWFRRVGSHGAFAEIAKRASDMLSGPADLELRSRLLPQQQWDPFGFINACEQVAGRPRSETDRRRLQEIQGLEFEALLHWLTRKG
jgi:hypothetical protein